MDNQSLSKRLTRIADIVCKHLEDTAEKFPHPSHDPKYRMLHTLRVAQYGKIIASEEGANIELVIAACLLHDIAHFESEVDYRNHGRLGAQLSRPILENLNFKEEEIDNICYSIAVHVDGNAGFPFENTLEAQVVSDADNIDRFGAYRAIQWCMDDIENYEALIDKLRNRLVKLTDYHLNNPLETKTGRELFRQQLEFQIELFNKIIKESELTQIPNLDLEVS